jgi:hypothetical protein
VIRVVQTNQAAKVIKLKIIANILLSFAILSGTDINISGPKK